MATGNSKTTEATEMTVEIEGNTLVIRIPMNPKPVPSATGKTLVVASSHGNIPTAAKINGKNVTVGFNAYIKNN
jgi:polysaccharide deacetylase 2 family uncharacterized protein YibQ